MIDRSQIPDALINVFAWAERSGVIEALTTERGAKLTKIVYDLTSLARRSGERLTTSEGYQLATWLKKHAAEVSSAPDQGRAA